MYVCADAESVKQIFVVTVTYGTVQKNTAVGFGEKTRRRGGPLSFLFLPGRQVTFRTHAATKAKKCLRREENKSDQAARHHQDERMVL